MAKPWKKIDEKVLIAPGEKAILKKRDALGEDLFPDRGDAEASLAADVKAIDALQDRLWAERTRALLVGGDTAPGMLSATSKRIGPSSGV